MRPTRVLAWTGMLAMAALCTALPAAAAPCAGDDECDDGYACIPDVCADCPMGAECPPCEEGGECVAMFSEAPTLYSTVECEADSDCPTSFTCEWVWDECSSWPGIGCECPPCPAGQECEDCDCDDRAAPGDCEPTTSQICIFVADACGSDADCDAGWTCQAGQECSSAGCACPPCACPPCEAGEECPECECDEECRCDEERECEEIGSWCLPGETPCEADGDCESGWTCADIPVGGSSCVCAACPPCPPGEPCDECPPCECDDDMDTEDFEGMCLPESWAKLLEDGALYFPGGGEASLGGDGAGGSPRVGDNAPNPSAGDNQPGGGSGPGSSRGCRAAGSGGPGGAGGLLALSSLIAVLTLRRRR